MTLDGSQREHDRIRVRPDGAPTFERIVENLVAVQQVDLDLLVRINVSSQNRGSLFELIETLRSTLNPSGVQVEFAPVDDISVGFNQVIDCNHESAALWCSLYREAHQAGFTVRPKGRVKCVYCEYSLPKAGIVVNADGKLYSCWDALGREELSLGDVEQGFRPMEECTARWRCCGYGATYDSERRAHFWEKVNDCIFNLIIADYSLAQVSYDFKGA